MALRQRTFLECENWVKTPWMDDPTSKPSVHRLIDVIARIPGLLEDGDRIHAGQVTCDAAKMQEVESYHRQLINVLRDLLNWRWDWERSHSAKAIGNAASSSTTSTTLDGKPRDPEQLYLGFKEDREPMLYNTALRQVMDLLEAWNVPDTSLFELYSLPHQIRKLPLSSSAVPDGIVPLTEIACEMCRVMDSHEGEPFQGASHETDTTALAAE